MGFLSERSPNPLPSLSNSQRLLNLSRRKRPHLLFRVRLHITREIQKMLGVGTPTDPGEPRSAWDSRGGCLHMSSDSAGVCRTGVSDPHKGRTLAASRRRGRDHFESEASSRRGGLRGGQWTCGPLGFLRRPRRGWRSDQASRYHSDSQSSRVRCGLRATALFPTSRLAGKMYQTSSGRM